MKTLIIVPAYNEEQNLPGVIQDLRTHMPEAEILIVNDGSSDNTEEAAIKEGALLCSLPLNTGIGSAVQTGYIYAARNGFECAVQFDGDGQHMAAHIAALTGPIKDGLADLTVGSRFMENSGYRAPLTRKVGIGIFAAFLSLICQQRLTDTTSGFRALGKRAILTFARHYPDDYPEVEALVMAKKKGLVIRELPVSMRQRSAGRSSITPLLSAYYMIKVMLAIIIRLSKR